AATIPQPARALSGRAPGRGLSGRAPRRGLSGGAARARGAGRLAGHERAREGRALRRVLVEGGLQTREGSLAPGEADPVDGEIVDEARVEVVLRVAPRAHARRGLH